MNTEIFIAVLSALISYRFLSPLIDYINPLKQLTKPQVMSAHALNHESVSGAGLKQ